MSDQPAATTSAGQGRGLAAAFDASSPVAPTPPGTAARAGALAVAANQQPAPPAPCRLDGIIIHERVPQVLQLQPPNYGHWRVLFELLFQQYGVTAHVTDFADQVLRELGDPATGRALVMHMFRGLHPRFYYTIPMLTSRVPYPSFLECRALVYARGSGSSSDTALHVSAPANSNNSTNNRNRNRRNKGKEPAKEKGAAGGSGKTSSTPQLPAAPGTNPWTGLVQAWPVPWGPHAPGTGILGPRPAMPPAFAGSSSHYQAAPAPMYQPPAPVFQPPPPPSAPAWDQQALNALSTNPAPQNTGECYLDTGTTSHMSSDTGYMKLSMHARSPKQQMARLLFIVLSLLISTQFSAAAEHTYRIDLTSLAVISCQESPRYPTASCCDDLLYAIDMSPSSSLDQGICCLCIYMMNRNVTFDLLFVYQSCGGKDAASVALWPIPAPFKPLDCKGVCYDHVHPFPPPSPSVARNGSNLPPPSPSVAKKGTKLGSGVIIGIVITVIVVIISLAYCIYRKCLRRKAHRSPAPSITNETDGGRRMEMARISSSRLMM